MKQWGGLWFPDHEVHMIDWMKKMSIVVDDRYAYQYNKLQACLPYITEWRNAVDIGSHIGTWSVHLTKLFKHVYAFEPVAEHRECFMKNVTGNFTLFRCALGNEERRINMETSKGSSGDTTVDLKDGPIEMHKLDDFQLDYVDFIKLDTEGFELFILEGGEQTITQCKPVIIVEQKPNKATKYGLGETDAVDFLIGLGAVKRECISGDYIMSWDK